MKMPVFNFFAYKHFFVETLVQISSWTKLNHLISKKIISEVKWIQVYLRNFACINENWLSL